LRAGSMSPAPSEMPILSDSGTITLRASIVGRQATDIPYTDPLLVNGVETYPADQDYLLRDIKPLYEKYGVNGVSFGHSHVYERYCFNGVNYIEAASIGNSYVNPGDPLHSGQGDQYPVTFQDCRLKEMGERGA
jgi:hypothetical protein